MPWHDAPSGSWSTGHALSSTAATASGAAPQRIAALTSAPARASSSGRARGARGCTTAGDAVDARAVLDRHGGAADCARDIAFSAASAAAPATAPPRMSVDGACAAPLPAKPPLAPRGTRGGAAAAASAAACAGAAEPGSLTVRTATGIHVLPPTSVLAVDDGPPHPCAYPHLFQPFLASAMRLLSYVPRASEAKLVGATERFREVLRHWGIAVERISWHHVIAYITIRCAPVVGFEVPRCCATPVLPSTAAGDVDALRRASRLRVLGMEQCREALDDERVSALLRAISARIKRLRTAKRALLHAEVMAFWRLAVKSGSAIAIRDAFALVIAFFFAMRVREMLALLPSDVEAVVLPGERLAMRVTFRSTKTRQSVFSTHEPFVVTCAHEDLTTAWRLFEEKVEYYEGVPIFHALRGSTRDPLSRAWFAAVVARAAPQATPHSCRVGCATEMWAAGVQVADIMAHGRWTSVAAVLYIVGVMEDQVRASDAIGSAGKLIYAGADLRKVGLGACQPAPGADAGRWADILAALPLEEAD